MRVITPILLLTGLVMPSLLLAQTISNSGSTNLCPGATRTLTATGAASGSSYQWRKNGANVGTNAATYIANAAGSYDVVVTDPSLTVTTYTGVVLTSVSNPVAGFTNSADNNCADVAINFTNASTGNAPLTYVWDFNDPNSGAANSSTAQDPSRGFVGNSGNGTQNFAVQLIVTDVNGCVNSVTHTIVKKQLPSTLMGGTGVRTYDNKTYFAICGSVSGNFTFTNTSTTNATNTNYKIVFGNGSADFNSGTFTSTTQTYSTGVYTINYTVTGGNGCAYTQDKYVFVGTNPSGGISSPGSTDVCTGQTLTFPINNVAGNTVGTTYTVDFHDGTTPLTYDQSTVPASVSHVFNTNSCGYTALPAYSNSFYATIVAANACLTTTGLNSPIYVSQKPVADFTLASTTVCQNVAVALGSNASTFKNAASGGCTSGTSVWIITPSTGFTLGSGQTLGNDFSSNDPSVWSAGTNNLSITFTSPGTYSVKLRIGGNAVCGPDEITKTICVNATPTASFTVDNSTGCTNLAVKTTNTSSVAGCGTNTYAWTLSYAATSGCSPSTSNYSYTSGSASSTNPEFQFNNPGTYTLKLVNSVTGGCSSPQASQAIVVKEKPTIGISAASSICSGTLNPTATISACSGTISGTAWTFTGGSPASSSSASPGTITYGTSGTYTIALDVTNECGVTSLTRTVTVKPTPEMNAVSNQTKCASSASDPIIFSATEPGSSFAWTNNTTSIGLGSSGSSNISAFTMANSGSSPLTATVTVTPSLNGCSGTPLPFTITANPKPSALSVSTPVNYCQNSTPAQLTATAGPGNTLMWYNNVGLSGGSTTAPTPSTTSAGSTTYYVTQQNAYPCVSNASSITVSVTAAIASNTITADQTICNGTSAATLAGSTPTGGTGSFTYLWESSTDNTSWGTASGTSNAINYSPGAIAASRYYRRKVTSGACFQDMSNTVLVTVQAGLSGTGISSSQSICQGSTPSQLTGSAVTGGTGTYTYAWESSANNSTWSSLGISTPDYQPTAASATIYYRRTVSSGSCNITSQVTITVTPTVSSATIASTQTICLGSSAASLTGAAPTGGTGSYTYQWQSSPDGSTWSNIGSGSTSISYAPGAVSTTTSYRRNASSGACLSVSSNAVTVTVLPALANIGINADQFICEGNTTALLNGLLPTGGTGAYTYSWENSTNNSTWTPIASTNTQNYQPPVLNTTTYYRRTVSSGACSATSSSVKMTIYNLPTTGTLSQNFVNTCYGSNVTLSTSAFIGTVKKWQTNPTPLDPTGWVDVASSASSSVTFSNVQSSFDVRVIVQQDGGCGNEIASASIPVTVSVPTVPGTTASDATVCINSNNGTVTLSGQTGSVVRWESSTNNGSSWSSISNTTTSHTYNNLVTTTLFRAIVQSGFCPQQPSASTRITVVPNLTASNAGADQALCAQLGLTLNGNNPSIGTGAWTQTGGPAVTITNPLLRNSAVTGIQNGQIYKFTWTITGPGCPSSADEVQIVNTPPITVANAGPDQLVCTFTSPSQAVTLAANSLVNPAFETGAWTLVSSSPSGAAPTITNASSPASGFSFVRSAIYTLKWTISNGACPATSDQVVVSVYDKPIVGPLTPSVTVGCVGNDITIAAGSTFKGVISKWQYNFTTLGALNWTDTNVAVNPIVFANVRRSFNARLISVSAGASAGCANADTSAVPVEIIPDFSNDIDTTALSVCPGQSISIAGQLPSGAYNVFDYQWQQSKDGKTNWTNIAGQTFTNLNMIPLTTSYVRRVVIVSPCSKISPSVYVFVRPSVGNFLVSDSIGTCFPFDVTFTNLVLPSTVTTWNFGDGAFNEGDVVTHTYHSTGTFDVLMTAQYPGGCKFEATRKITITGPKGILKYDLQAICMGKQMYFETAASGIDSLRWSFGDGTSTITTGKTVFHSYKQAGPYVPYVELLAGPEGKCRTRINGADTIFVDLVQAGFRQSLVQECAATQAAFTDTSRAFYGIASREWTFGDGERSVLKDPAHTYKSANTWSVREIVTANLGCKDTAIVPVPVRIWSIPQIKTNLDSISCVDKMIPFQASVFSEDAVRSTVWNFSNGSNATTSIAPKAFDFPGSYMAIFIATTVNGCADTIRLPIRVYPKLAIELGPDRTLPTGTRLPLTSVVTNGPVAKWKWTPSTDLTCNDCNEPVATVKKAVTYRADATTAEGCEASDTIAIKPFCESAQLFIPNVFSPDGDGINDVLMVRGQGIKIVKSFRIFNRWGMVVFERSNFSPNEKSNGWDGRVAGKAVAPDVYVYTCEAVCENDVSYEKHGNITVIKNKQ